MAVARTAARLTPAPCCGASATLGGGSPPREDERGSRAGARLRRVPRLVPESTDPRARQPDLPACVRVRAHGNHEGETIAETVLPSLREPRRASAAPRAVPSTSRDRA